MSARPSSAPLLTRSLRRVLGSRVTSLLTYPHGVDRYLEQFDATWSTTEVRAEVVAIRHPTADSVTLSLRPNGNWQGFRAGQYVRLTIEIDGRRRTRCYSPANSVHARDGLIELTAKAHRAGVVSQHLKHGLAVGTVVGLSQAEGVFALPDLRPRRILLISGGSGITPVMAMLRTLCDEGHAGPITFLHYANTRHDQLYADDLQAIATRCPNVQLLRAYGDAAQGGELAGLFSREHLRSAVPDYAEAQTFLCGPPAMMQAVQQVWTDDGLANRLHLEHFTAATPASVDARDAVGEIRFTRSERFAANTGATLLEQAEAAGLKPESGCRIGICHTCTCTKRAGRVRDTRTGEVSDAGEGEIQICVSVPVGTVTLDL